MLRYSHIIWKKNISLSATYAYLYWMLGSYTSM